MKIVNLLVAAVTMFSYSAMAQAPANDSILVDEYITTQEFIEAKVVRVQPTSRTMTVRGEKRGDTRQFEVPEGTRISVNGKPARLRDIQKGDQVLLAMKPKQEKVVISSVRVPQREGGFEQRPADPIVATAALTSLPKTASSWPAVLLIAVLAMLGAATLRLVSRAR